MKKEIISFIAMQESVDAINHKKAADEIIKVALIIEIRLSNHVYFVLKFT